MPSSFRLSYLDVSAVRHKDDLRYNSKNIPNYVQQETEIVYTPSLKDYELPQREISLWSALQNVSFHHHQLHAALNPYTD